MSAPYSIDVQAGTDNYNIVTAEDQECAETNDEGETVYIDCIYPFKEDANYIQGILQIELPLPNDYQVNVQYFQYDIKEYTNLLTEYDLPTNVQLPNIQIDISNADSEDLFLPGMGAPYSILSKKLTFINRLLKCLFFGQGSGKRIHISEIELCGQYSSNNW